MIHTCMQLTHHQSLTDSRPGILCECHEPLDCLNILSGYFIVQHMSDIVDCSVVVGSRVHSYTGDSQRPSGVSDRETEVCVVGFLVVPLLHVIDNFSKETDNILAQLSRPQSLEERFQVLSTLDLGCCGQLALCGTFYFFCNISNSDYSNIPGRASSESPHSFKMLLKFQ